ncbi:WD40 repeat domain-containing protein [Nitrobacter sp.]|uniref:WD40 repeat domain-containing protein n=1 Tax=Nitrobacter sp. TaxID=29420 RepID=UPI00399D6732
MMKALWNRFPIRKSFGLSLRIGGAILVLTTGLGDTRLSARSSNLKHFSLREVRTCQPASGQTTAPALEVTGVGWSDDGSLIAGYSAYGTQVTVWDSHDCQKLHSFFVNDSQYVGPSIAFAAGGTRLFTPASMASRNDNQYTIDLWDVSASKVIERIEGPAGHAEVRKNRLAKFSLSPKGNLIAFSTADYGSPVTVFDRVTSEIAIFISSPRKNTASSLAFSSNNNGLAIGYINGLVRVFANARDPSSEEFFAYDQSSKIGVDAVIFSPDGSHIATGALVGSTLPASLKYSSIKLWQTATHHLAKEAASQSGSVKSLSWSPAGKYIAAIISDRTLAILDSSNGEIVETKQFGPVSVYVTAFSPSGRELAVATGSGLKIFKVSE